MIKVHNLGLGFNIIVYHTSNIGNGDCVPIEQSRYLNILE
nr:MAG TPA: hypothetical protein [Caudoviricetes sp.]